MLQNQIIFRTSIPILAWIKAPEEAWAGLPMEGKVLQWKWYLAELLRSGTLSAKGSVPKALESILQTNCPMTPQGLSIIPNATPPQKQVPLGHWGTGEYQPSLVNAWFMGGSATSKQNEVLWKAAAYRPGDGW